MSCPTKDEDWDAEYHINVAKVGRCGVQDDGREDVPIHKGCSDADTTQVCDQGDWANRLYF